MRAKRAQEIRRLCVAEKLRLAGPGKTRADDGLPRARLHYRRLKRRYAQQPVRLAKDARTRKAKRAMRKRARERAERSDLAVATRRAGKTWAQFYETLAELTRYSTVRVGGRPLWLGP